MFRCQLSKSLKITIQPKISLLAANALSLTVVSFSTVENNKTVILHPKAIVNSYDQCNVSQTLKNF